VVSKQLVDKLKFLALSLFLAMQAAAFAGTDLMVEKAFYEDKTGIQTFAQVQDQPLTQLKEILNEGYSDSAFWVRIKLDKAQLQDQEKVAIKITPPYLDEITLYVDGRPVQVVGDRYPSKNNSVTALSFNFVTTYKADSPMVWVRLKTTSTSLMSVEVMRLDELNSANVTEYLLSGLLIGLLCAVTVLGASYYVAEREVVNGTFLIKQLFAVVLAFVYFGYLRVLMNDSLDPEFLDYVTSVSILLYTASSLLFYCAFFSEFEPKQWVRKYWVLSIATVFVAAVFFALGHVRIAMGLNMKIIAITSVMLVLVPVLGIDWKTLKNPPISKFFLITSQALSLLVLLYTSLPSLGLFSGSKFSAYVVMLNAVILSFIMLLMVRYRAITLDKERVMEIAAQASKAEHEKAQRERQEQFMAMLTHEIKTPLALIRFAVRNALGKGKSSERIEQAVDDINTVIERCQQVDKLEKGWVFTKQSQSIQELVGGCVDRLEQRERVHVSALPALNW